MYKGEWSSLKNAGVFILIGIHSFILALCFFNKWINPISIFCLFAGGSLIVLALITFMINKYYYYYFLIGFVVGSIPVIFFLPYSSIIIIPEVILLLSLMFRSLTKGETYIKTYEAGLTNIPRNLTSLKVSQNDSNQKELYPKKNQPNVKMFFVTLTLTMMFFFSLFLPYLIQ